jgi:hypothetical protein
LSQEIPDWTRYLPLIELIEPGIRVVGYGGGGQNQSFPKEKRLPIWTGTNCYLMTSGKHCALMHLSRCRMPVIKYILECLRPATYAAMAQMAIFWLVFSLL